MIAFAFFFPDAKRIIFLLERIVFIPMVSARVGILEKIFELFLMVCFDSFTSLVFESGSEPGSLNAMCPLVPTPRMVRSIGNFFILDS